jgi:gamma-glutamylcyclotransferase (GGCT)/AIG2-like uncharacterized protein YtfP
MPATFTVTATVTCDTCNFVYELPCALNDDAIITEGTALLDADFDPGPCPTCGTEADWESEYIPDPPAPTIDDHEEYEAWWGRNVTAVDEAWARPARPAPAREPRHPNALVAVYGTLRSHCGNDVLWRGQPGCESLGVDSVKGYRLVSNGSFPYAVVDLTAESVVEVLIVTPEVLDRLDALEGYPTHYDRHVVTTVDGLEGVHIYSPPSGERHASMAAVPRDDHGRYDWLLEDRVAARFAAMADD